MQLNYEQTIADIRAEIERLEREYGAAQAYVATFRLLTAMELLAEANKAQPMFRGEAMTELPAVGDVIKSPPFSYRVIKIDGNRVTYEAQHLTWGYVSSRTVTLEEWQQVVDESRRFLK